jgi:hypothetical protein
VNEQTQKREYGKIKWVMIKVASTLSVAEIEYDTVKRLLRFHLDCPSSTKAWYSGAYSLIVGRSHPVPCFWS